MILIFIYSLALAWVATVSAQDDGCLVHDSPPPECSDYVDPAHGWPVFIEHAYNCSRFWVCKPDLTDCLFECAPMVGGSLYFDVSIQYPDGPVCNYPDVIDCENKPYTCQCEVWQDCIDGYLCTPDCKLDKHCNGDEYCDYEDGGEGVCIKGCRNGANCGKCGDCVNHICQDPECCTDADCPAGICLDGTCQGCRTDNECPGCATCESNQCTTPECCIDSDCLDGEYCEADNTCQKGCRDNTDCPMSCDACTNHQCGNPDCCVDPDCLDSEYCNADNICQEGCRDDADCPMSCDTCDNHVCSNPECCIDSDCLDSQYCESDNTCQDGCRTDSDCTMPCDACENHTCSNPECCEDPDCLDSEVCDTDNICKEGCRDDSMCPGFDAVCDLQYTNCHYCNNTANEIGQCNPGCVDDSNCPSGSACNGYHNCVTEGDPLLVEIVVSTDSCKDCQGTKIEDGVRLHIVGGEGLNGQVVCDTNKLDNKGEVDYKDMHIAMFNGQEIVGQCYKANLLSQITEGTITWTASQGEWTPARKMVQFEWSGDSRCTYACCLSRATLSPANPTASLVDCGNDCSSTKMC